MAEQRFLIRAARKDEARRIAAFYRISSDGVADYIWAKLAGPGEDVLDVGKRRYEREDTAFSYQNCRMVELDDIVVGMLVAFPMALDPDYVEPDPVLLPYSKLEEDQSYYVCGVAIDPDCRGRGLGTYLMHEAEKSCGRLGYRTLSLIVFEQNLGAKRLYERHGYVEVARQPVVPHPLLHYTGDAILMVKHLEQSWQWARRRRW